MLEVDKKTFEPEVLQAEGYVLVDFFGDGCVPCQALMPHVHAYADKYGDKIKFTSLNTTKARRLAIGQKILGLLRCNSYSSDPCKYYLFDVVTEFFHVNVPPFCHHILPYICQYILQ